MLLNFPLIIFLLIHFLSGCCFSFVHCPYPYYKAVITLLKKNKNQPIVLFSFNILLKVLGESNTKEKKIDLKYSGLLGTCRLKVAGDYFYYEASFKISLKKKKPKPSCLFPKRSTENS